MASFLGFRSRTLTFFFAFFCAILFFFLVLVCCFCCVSGTEQQLMPALNVLFWNQVIQANQFIFSALGPLISWLSGGRIFFVLRCTHFGFMLSASVPSFTKHPLKLILVIFLPQLEEFTHCMFYQVGHSVCAGDKRASSS